MQIGLFSWFLTAILLFLTVIVTIDFFMAWEEKKAASRDKRAKRQPVNAEADTAGVKLDTEADRNGADRVVRPYGGERKSEGGPSGRPAPTGANKGRTGSPAPTGAEDGPSGRPAPTGAESSRRDAGIDLMGAPRPTFRVTLPIDGKVLHLRMPTKAVSDRFAEMGDRMEHFAAGTQTEEDVETLFDFAGALLANSTENQTGAKFPAHVVKKRMTLDEVVLFVTAYMEWMTEVLTSKN